MVYIYPAVFYPDEDGSYSVVFADFELATQGDDLQGAVFMAEDALGGRIYLMLEEGESLLNPSNPKKVKPETKDGFVSLVTVDLDKVKSNLEDTPVKKTLTIPSWLNKAAERKNINFSTTLKDALVKKLSQ